MMTDRKSGALFAANRDLVLHNQLANVFESNRSLMQLHATRFGDRVDQVRRRHRLRDAILPSPGLHQVVEQQSDYIIGLQKSSIGIDNSKAIRITISRNAYVGSCRL